MPYIGNSQVAGVHQNNFKILDDISSYTETFDGSSSSVVNTTNNTIAVSQHRFYHGQRVTYSNGGGGNIGGLASGTVYYAVADSHSTIKLAASLADAIGNIVINLSALGSGTSHTLNNSFDGVNTKFKLTHSGGNGVNLTNASHATVAINNVIQRPNLNDTSFTEGFAIEGGKNIVFKVAPTSTDTFWGNTIAESVGTFDSTDHVIDTFTADGTTTNFNLTKNPPSIRDIHITLDGVTQHTSAFSLQGNVLVFSTAPANGTAIQVKHMGFVGASVSGVTGFYGRIGNVSLQDSDTLRGDGSLISNLPSTVGGNTGIDFNDNVKVRFGTSNNLEIYHNPVNSYIANNSNNLFITNTDGDIFIQPKAGENSIICNDDGSVQLYHDNVLKCQTRDFGFSIFQDLNISNNLNVAGVSTFSNPISVAATAHFASQQFYFGPVLNTGEISIDILDNGIAATFDHNDTSGLGLFIRTGSDLYLLADHKTNTASNGDGYGLIIQSGSGNIIPSHDFRPQLGLSNREFGTIFADQLNISGVSTFSGYANVGNRLYFGMGTGTKYMYPSGTDIKTFIGSEGNFEVTLNASGGTGGTFIVEKSSGTSLLEAKGTGIVDINGRVSIGGENPGHFYSGADNLVVADFSADAGISIFGGGSNKSTIAMGSTTFGSGAIEAFIEKTHGNTGPLKLATQISTSNIEIEAGNDFVVSGYSGPTERLRVNSTGATFAGTLSAANYAGFKAEQGSVDTTSLNGTFNFHLGNGHVRMFTSATAGNYNPNFHNTGSKTINNSMSVGDTVSATLIVASSSHYCTSSIQIDGTTTGVTVEWVGGSAPSAANGSGYDIYSFTIIKTASTPTYTVFANAISAA